MNIESLLSPLEGVAGLLVGFVLHATVLLGLVWLLDRARLLKHPGWAELAWRVALFGAFASTAFTATSPLLHDAAATLRARVAQDAPVSARASAVSVDNVPATRDAARDAVASVPASWVQRAIPGGSAVSATPFRRGFEWHADVLLLALVLVAWALGALWMGVRTLRQARALLRLRTQVLRDGVAADAALHATAAEIARSMAVDPPALRVLSGIVSPLVLPGMVVLPPWAQGLDAAQRRAMLAHEIAHLQRRDPWWRPLQRMALVPLFFHPLAWQAVRRLETLAEALCDRAAAVRGDGRALAECLAECLARETRLHHPGWSLAMAERPGGLVERVKALLEASRLARPPALPSISTAWRRAAIVAAVLVVIALPTVAVISRDGQRFSIDYRVGDDGAVNLDMRKRNEHVHVDGVGKFTLTDDERDVASIADGAFLDIAQDKDGVERRLRVTGARGGLRRAYTVDGATRPYDAEAGAWLAALIPGIYRETGMDAEARILRLLHRGGAARALAEIEAIRSDYVRGQYVGYLMMHAHLDEPQLTRLIGLVAAMDSDFEKRGALIGLLRATPMSTANEEALLAAATTIDSDFERAEWVVAAAGRISMRAGSAGWRDVFAAFDSDFEQSRALQQVVAEGRPRADAIGFSLVAGRRIDSDFERRQLLQHVTEQAGAYVPTAAYLAVADEVDSDFDLREALLALIAATPPDVARSRAILRSARGIDSDFERGTVLGALAKVMPNDPQLIEEYRAMARSMGDYERGQAEKALDRFAIL